VYSYYLCVGRIREHFGGKRVCENGIVRVETLDDAVWEDVRSLLGNPKRIEEEFNRRLERGQKDEGANGAREIQRILLKLKRSIARLIDAYGDGLLEKSEFEPRIRSLKERQTKAEEELKTKNEKEYQERELRLVMSRLGEFAQKVKDALQEADWNTRREIIRTLVKRIEIDPDRVRIVYRVLPEPPSGETFSQHCCNRVESTVEAIQTGKRTATGTTRSSKRRIATRE
jgi:site-specific DNA recombinase